MEWLQSISAPIVVAAIAASLTALGWYLRSHWESLRREREMLQSERRRVYLQVLEPYIRAMTGLKSQQENKKAAKQITSFDHRRALFEINILGSDEVIRAFNDMMQYFYGMEENHPEETSGGALEHLGSLLVAIRRDLGSKKTELTAMDMLKSQVNDIDKFLSNRSN